MTAPDGGAGPNPTSVDRPRRVFSRFYAAMSKRMDDEGLRDLRTELLADLTGTVVEIGAGNGRNFACYPTTVTRVHAIEPEPHLRSLATAAAATAPVSITVHAAVAEHLPLPEASADAVVFCLVLCSIPNRTAALAEARRVLRPHGTLRFFEHTIATTRGLRTAQRLADATLWPMITGGCQPPPTRSATSTEPASPSTRTGCADSNSPPAGSPSPHRHTSSAPPPAWTTPRSHPSHTPDPDRPVDVGARSWGGDQSKPLLLRTRTH